MELRLHNKGHAAHKLPLCIGKNAVMLQGDFGTFLIWGVPVAGVAQLALVWHAASRAGFRLVKLGQSHHVAIAASSNPSMGGLV